MSCKSVIPSEISAGTAFQVTVCLENYPSPPWSAQLLLRGPQSINLSGAGDRTTYSFVASATETAAWQPGTYWFSLRISQGQKIIEIARGQTQVEPDFALLPAGYDGRSQSEIALEAIDAVLGKRATTDQNRYRINNRELWRMSIADLLNLRSYYANRVTTERRAGRGCSAFGTPVIVRFRS